MLVHERRAWSSLILGLTLLLGGCLQSGLRGPGAVLSSGLAGQAGEKVADVSGLETAESFRLERGQLVLHTNFYLPPTHPMIEDLVALRSDVFRRLKLEPGTEPIQVHLYRSPQDLARITRQTGDPILQRRAYFLQTDEALRVYASWTYDVGTDLRHELTHGYLHSVRPSIPLWLDEGLAEYFEVPRSELGKHSDHLALLARLHRSGQANFDLERLESLTDPATFAQADYAISWLWVALLLSRPDTAESLANYFQALPMDGTSAQPLSATLPTVERQRLLREFLESRVSGAAVGY